VPSYCQEWAVFPAALLVGAVAHQLGQKQPRQQHAMTCTPEQRWTGGSQLIWRWSTEHSYRQRETKRCSIKLLSSNFSTWATFQRYADLMKALDMRLGSILLSCASSLPMKERLSNVLAKKNSAPRFFWPRAN